MTSPAGSPALDPVAATRRVRRRRPGGKALVAIGASGAVVIAGAVTAIVVVTSGPSYPHAWCGPALAQLHANENQAAFDRNMAALESQGAPIANLISDGHAAVQDQTLRTIPATSLVNVDELVNTDELLDFE